jgi:NADH dehydrogenase [ubiquinone] 1 alpha subcomplex assembly factor 7
MEETKEGYKSTSKSLGVPVIWTEDIRFVPKGKNYYTKTKWKGTGVNADLLNIDPGKSPFIIAHEFFDALPIHAFQSIHPTKPEITTSTTSPHGPPTPQWRELLVAPTPFNSTHVTRAANSPEFQLSLAKSPTPHSLLLPEISPRYKALKSHPGSLIEISPEALFYATDFALRIGGDTTNNKKPAPSGAALILDYGPSSTIPLNSLRGIRAHKAVSPFSSPGLVDLSADVDFTALAEAALGASPGVEVHGPVEQGFFLQAMGIRERAEQLLKGVKDEEGRGRIEGSWKRLVERGGGGMGRIYKVMAIVPTSGGTGRRPVGFGGDVDI